MHRRFNIKYLVVILLLIPWILFAQDNPGRAVNPVSLSQAPTMQPVSARAIFMAGDDQALYVVKPGSQNDQPAFQVRFRARTSPELSPGKWYQGLPEVVAAWNGKLVVFTESGGCFSYSSDSASSLPPLPEGHKAIIAQGDNNGLLVLARRQNEFGLFELSGLSGWKQFDGVIDLTDWDIRTLALIRQNETIALYGWQQNRGYQLLQFNDGQPGILSTLSLPDNESAMSRPARLYALSVNRDTRLIAAFETPRAGYSYKIGWLENGELRFSNNLMETLDSYLNIKPDDIGFASNGQMIAAASFAQDDRLYLGYFTPNGFLSLPMEPLASQRVPLHPLFNIFARQELIFIGMLILGMIVFNRRSEAFVPAIESLPSDVIPAHPFRRLLAFLIDNLIILFISGIVFQLIASQRFTEEQMLHANEALYQVFKQYLGYNVQEVSSTDSQYVVDIVKIYAITSGVVFLLYFIVLEGLFSFTPGKRVLKLVVLDYEGRPLSPWKSIVRNGLRVIDTNAFMLFFTIPIMFVTPRRQRPGDLAARTIVALATPELIKRIVEQNKRILLKRQEEMRKDDNDMF